MTATTRVPFLDLRAPYDELRDEIDGAIRRVLESGWYLLGEEISAFEQQFNDWLHTPHGRFAAYYAARERFIAA